MDAVVTGPQLISFTSGSGTIPVSGSAQLVLDGPGTHLDGGASTIVVSDNSFSGGTYSTIARAHGLVIKNMHFDNSASGGTGCAFLMAAASAASTTQYPYAYVRNCYFRNGGGDDCVWVAQQYRTTLFEYCIFDGTTTPGEYACSVGFTDNVGPGYDLPFHVIFKHCIFLGKGRFPDCSAGMISLLGCTLQRIHSSCNLRGYAKANLINNWFLNPSDTGPGNNPGSTMVTRTDIPVNGQNLRAGAIYSLGNYQDGVAESSWVARDYAAGFYTDFNTPAAASATYFRSTPHLTLPYVPDAIDSRRLTLASAGPKARSTNAQAAVNKVIGRRLLDVL